MHEHDSLAAAGHDHGFAHRSALLAVDRWVLFLPKSNHNERRPRRSDWSLIGKVRLTNLSSERTRNSVLATT
jgi:hypothetical protein